MDSIGEGMRTCVDLYVTGVTNARSLDKEAVVDAMREAQFEDPKGEITIDPEFQSAVLNDYIAEIAPPSNAPAWQRLGIVETFESIEPQQQCLSEPPA